MSSLNIHNFLSFHWCERGSSFNEKKMLPSGGNTIQWVTCASDYNSHSRPFRLASAIVSVSDMRACVSLMCCYQSKLHYTTAWRSHVSCVTKAKWTESKYCLDVLIQYNDSIRRRYNRHESCFVKLKQNERKKKKNIAWSSTVKPVAHVPFVVFTCGGWMLHSNISIVQYFTSLQITFVILCFFLRSCFMLAVLYKHTAYATHRNHYILCPLGKWVCVCVCVLCVQNDIWCVPRIACNTFCFRLPVSPMVHVHT